MIFITKSNQYCFLLLIFQMKAHKAQHLNIEPKKISLGNFCKILIDLSKV